MVKVLLDFHYSVNVDYSHLGNRPSTQKCLCLYVLLCVFLGESNFELFVYT